jgi:tRNA threonylcarbamoyladenosine biosynthesis protein TsaB
MAVILNIESATPLCSVALSIHGKVLLERETNEEKSHASRLTVFIQEILAEQGIKIADLDAIAVGKGPGSYTGLRIGISAAKGLCYGADKPIIAVSTLRILLQQILSNPTHTMAKILAKPDTLLCPMIDARRMEVFTCLYNTRAEEVEPIAARIIDQDTYSAWFSSHNIVFFGSGMDKCRTVLHDKKALFVAGIQPHAASLAPLAEEKFNQGAFEDVAYFEPFYLKDFIASTPKKGLSV